MRGGVRRGAPTMPARTRLCGPTAVFVEQRDGLRQHRCCRGLYALASVLFLRGQPSVVALDREAQDPVLAEFRLELVHVGLEVGRPVAFGAVVSRGAGLLLSLLGARLVVAGR